MRTKNFAATTLPYTPKATELQVDENGNVIFPKWFSDRESQIETGQLDPYQRDTSRETVDPSTLPYEVDPLLDLHDSAPKQSEPQFAESKDVVVERIAPIKVEPASAEPAVPHAQEVAAQEHDEL